MVDMHLWIHLLETTEILNFCAIDNGFNPWSPGGTLMVQKMGIIPPIPSFKG